MPRINGHCKIRTAADGVGSIGSGIEALVVVHAHGCDEVPARGEAKHADLARIDVPLGGTGSHESHRPLRILQGHPGLRVRAGFWIRTHIRHPVLHHHARDASGSQPVADLGALEIHGQDLISTTRENDDCGARVLALCRIDGHGRPRDVPLVRVRPPGDELLLSRLRQELRSRDELGVRRVARPERDLSVAWGRLPGTRLSVQVARREHSAQDGRPDPHHEVTSCRNRMRMGTVPRV